MSRRPPPLDGAPGQAYEQHVTRVLAHLTGTLERYMQRYPHTPLGACLEAAEDLVMILEDWVEALDGTLGVNDYEGS